MNPTKMKWLCTLVALAVVGCGGGMPARTGLFKPVSCTDSSCHAKWFKKAQTGNVHAALTEDGCRNCHRPHGEIASKVMVRKGDELCTSCHEQNPVPPGGSAHTGKNAPACLTCHQPHSSPLAHLAKEDPDTTCAGCHQSILETPQHKDPAVEKACLSCHTAHESSLPFLLQEAPNPCSSCHAGSDATMVKAHFGRAVTSGCLNCHAPHNAKREKFLLKYLHDPVINGECENCHESGTFKLTDTPEKLCLGCHDGDQKDTQAHHGKTEKHCLSCHNPHGSNTPKLLKAPAQALCTSCHGDLFPKDAPPGTQVHGSDKGVACLDCHKLHGEEPWKDPAKQGEACKNCHNNLPTPGHDAKLTGENAPCTACHNPHLKTKGLLKESAANLCASCHKGEEFDGPSRHFPPTDSTHDCLSCHQMHGGAGEHFLPKESGEVCASCHKVQAEDEPGTWHPPFLEKDCLACHKPHSSKLPQLMAREGSALCIECHDKETGKFPHDPYDRKCQSCHDGHGSEHEGMLLLSKKVLCYTCHDGMQRRIFAKGMLLHEPVREGECNACHEPHTSDNPGMIRVRGSALCTECHDTSTDEMNKAHRGRPLEKAECLECHDPHASPQVGLLHTQAHPAFIQGKCEDCHAK